MTAITDRRLIYDTSKAGFDKTREYRYWLIRRWDAGENPTTLAWLLLNPSTADETKDDPTMRRCAQYSATWGYGGMVVLNIFALRSTDPRQLYKHEAPIGPDNDATIEARLRGLPGVAAWGAHGAHLGRGLRLRARYPNLKVFGLTKGGQPKHPLYQRADAKVSAW